MLDTGYSTNNGCLAKVITVMTFDIYDSRGPNFAIQTADA